MSLTPGASSRAGSGGFLLVNEAVSLTSRGSNPAENGGPLGLNEAMSLTSGTCSRAESVQYFMDMHGMDRVSANLLLRAERLQEVGQLDQALLYFGRVLESYPELTEARMNVEMINRMRPMPALADVPLAPPQPPLPAKAQISLALRFSRPLEIKRLPEGRSQYTSTGEIGLTRAGQIEYHSQPLPENIFFPKGQSDQLWRELLDAIEDGSCLHKCEPGQADFKKMSVTIDGSPQQIYFACVYRGSPVEIILSKHVYARKAELNIA